MGHRWRETFDRSPLNLSLLPDALTPLLSLFNSSLYSFTFFHYSTTFTALSSSLSLLLFFFCLFLLPFVFHLAFPISLFHDLFHNFLVPLFVPSTRFLCPSFILSLTPSWFLSSSLLLASYFSFFIFFTPSCFLPSSLLHASYFPLSLSPSFHPASSLRPF